MWDPGFSKRGQICTPYIGRWTELLWLFPKYSWGNVPFLLTMYFWAVSLVDGCWSWLVLAWKSSLIHFHISSLKSATAYLQRGNGKTLRTRTLFFYELTIFLMYLIFHLTIMLFINLLSSMSCCFIHGIVFLSFISLLLSLSHLASYIMSPCVYSWKLEQEVKLLNSWVCFLGFNLTAAKAA